MSRKKGFEGEDLAREFLGNLGFEVLESNFYTPYGEIDIIARKDLAYHFIEVKSGRNFEPLQNVTPRKLQRIADSVAIYLAQNALDVEFCIDVVTIKDGRCEFFANISA